MARISPGMSFASAWATNTGTGAPPPRRLSLAWEGFCEQLARATPSIKETVRLTQDPTIFTSLLSLPGKTTVQHAASLADGERQQRTVADTRRVACGTLHLRPTNWSPAVPVVETRAE